MKKIEKGEMKLKSWERKKSGLRKKQNQEDRIKKKDRESGIKKVESRKWNQESGIKKRKVKCQRKRMKKYAGLIETGSKKPERTKKSRR